MDLSFSGKITRTMTESFRGMKNAYNDNFISEQTKI